MEGIKAIAVDIDGTLTDKSRKICVSAIESIRKVEDKGIPVIIVTGNVFFYAYATAVLVGCSGGIVAENGGVISHKKEDSHNEANDSQKLEVLGDINKAKKAYKHLKSNLEEEYDFEIVDDSDSRLSELAFYRTIDEKIVKEKLKDFDVEVYDTQFAIHLTDPNVNKGSSLEIVAKNIKIKPEEILAIGDSENDLEFLKVAGYKVAVANADESMKEIADYITKKPYGDGVAEIINKFFL